MLLAFSTASCGRAEGQHRQHRAEDLLAGDAVGLGDAGEQRRREPEAVGRAARTAGDQRSAPSASPMSESSRIRASCSAELIAPMSVFLSSGSPTRSVRHPALEPVEELVGDRLLHQQPRAGAADVALVEEDAVDDALDRLVDGASSKTMLAALPPSSRVTFLLVPATRLAIARPTSVEPVNATLSTSAWPTSAWPVSPAPVTMLTTPGGQVGLLADLGEQQRGQRRGLGRLEHDGVAAGQRRGDLPGQHQQREVPRDDLAGDAERLRVRPKPAYSSLSAQPA